MLAPQTINCRPRLCEDRTRVDLSPLLIPKAALASVRQRNLLATRTVVRRYPHQRDVQQFAVQLNQEDHSRSGLTRYTIPGPFTRPPNGSFPATDADPHAGATGRSRSRPPSCLPCASQLLVMTCRFRSQGYT